MAVASRQRTTSPEGEGATREALLDAAAACLKRDGYARLSTRRLAEEAGVPLSQIHYHFGSKRGLLLEVLEHQNRKLLERQQRMYGAERPLSERWLQACDFLDEDLDSGYVRVLQEIIAAGWSDAHIAEEARRILGAWYALLRKVAEEAMHAFGGLGPFTAAEAAVVAGHLFLGAESLILLGFSEEQMPARSALRKIGALLREIEANTGIRGNHARKATGS